MHYVCVVYKCVCVCVQLYWYVFAVIAQFCTETRWDVWPWDGSGSSFWLPPSSCYSSISFLYTRAQNQNPDFFPCWQFCSKEYYFPAWQSVFWGLIISKSICHWLPTLAASHLGTNWINSDSNQFQRCVSVQATQALILKFATSLRHNYIKLLHNIQSVRRSLAGRQQRDYALPHLPISQPDPTLPPCLYFLLLQFVICILHFAQQMLWKSS